MPRRARRPADMPAECDLVSPCFTASADRSHWQALLLHAMLATMPRSRLATSATPPASATPRTTPPCSLRRSMRAPPAISSASTECAWSTRRSACAVTARTSATALGTSITQADGTNLAAVLASDTWCETTRGRARRLHLVAHRRCKPQEEQWHGRHHDPFVADCDRGHPREKRRLDGIRITNLTRDGTTGLQTSQVNGRISNAFVESSGGSGIEFSTRKTRAPTGRGANQTYYGVACRAVVGGVAHRQQGARLPARPERDVEIRFRRRLAPPVRPGRRPASSASTATSCAAPVASARSACGTRRAAATSRCVDRQPRARRGWHGARGGRARDARKHVLDF